MSHDLPGKRFLHMPKSLKTKSVRVRRHTRKPKMRLYDVHVEGGHSGYLGRGNTTGEGTSEGYYTIKAHSERDARRLAKQHHRKFVMRDLQADSEISVHDEGDE